jgi:23S rRNA pseudouridine2605 synthase
MNPPRTRSRNTPSYGLARVLSKRGICSRAEAVRRIEAGRVSINGRRITNPEHPVGRDARIEIDGTALEQAAKVYVALNKPRGLVTTMQDEKGRKTVYECFQGASLPYIAPVGRLDQASEGLLLFTNDTAWGALLTDPDTHIDKVYHVQIDRIADNELLNALKRGAQCGEDYLTVKKAMLLRTGDKHSWLELTLDEGKNRHLRRLLEAYNVSVLRLVRVGIGTLALGELAKGSWRLLTEDEVQALRSPLAIMPR